MRVTGVGRASIQGDVAFADVLARMGANDRATATTGSRRAPGRAGFAASTIDCVAIPDAAMTLAVVALFARGPTTLTGIASWRVKETDRIAAMATEFAKLGATVDAGDDRMTIVPPARLEPATIDTYDDHRIAMCFSLAAFGGVRGAHHGSRLRAQDVSRLFRGVSRVHLNVDEVIARATPSVPVIAVDGPAASGKGTIAAGVAAALGFHLLDSGSLYRLVALKALENGNRARRRAGARRRGASAST